VFLHTKRVPFSFFEEADSSPQRGDRSSAATAFLPAPSRDGPPAEPFKEGKNLPEGQGLFRSVFFATASFFLHLDKDASFFFPFRGAAGTPFSEQKNLEAFSQGLAGEADFPNFLVFAASTSSFLFFPSCQYASPPG